MFKKINQQDMPSKDDLDQRLEGLSGKIRAPYKLRNAAKTGIPLNLRDVNGTTTHVKQFARAVVAYGLCVCLIIGGVVVGGGLLGGPNLAGSSAPGGQYGGDLAMTGDTEDGLTDAVVPENTDAPPSEFPPPDGVIKVDAPVYGDALTKLLAGKTNVNGAGLVNMDTLRAEGIQFWHADGAMQTMFDNTIHPGCSSGMNNCCAGGGVEEIVDKSEKLPDGTVVQHVRNDVRFYFDLNAPARVEAYTITSAIDNSIYTDRDPIAWTLYATNDPTLPMEEWTVLDDIYDGKIEEVIMQHDQVVPVGYEVDAENQGEYQYYCWNVTCVPNTALNVDEFALYVG